jgi:hypothetical protein
MCIYEGNKKTLLDQGSYVLDILIRFTTEPIHLGSDPVLLEIFALELQCI